LLGEIARIEPRQHKQAHGEIDQNDDDQRQERDEDARRCLGVAAMGDLGGIEFRCDGSVLA